jgi:transcriptional regulator with XRE-family HTH domain
MEIAALVVRTAREHARLSKRELARRAGTSPAAIVAYEAGTRDPTVGTLVRIVTAAGARVEFDVERTRPRPDPTLAGERLAQVLELAEHLPRRPAARHLSYPPFPRSA